MISPEIMTLLRSVKICDSNLVEIIFRDDKNKKSIPTDSGNIPALVLFASIIQHFVQFCQKLIKILDADDIFFVAISQNV